MNFYNLFLFLQEQRLSYHLYPLFQNALVAVLKDEIHSDLSLYNINFKRSEKFLEFLNKENPQVLDLILKSHNQIRAYDTQVEKMKAQNIEFIFWGEPNYPENFYVLSDAPLWITYKGARCWKSEKKISFVGSREPAIETRKWIELHLIPFLQKEKFTLISGGARGIDQLGHLASLRAGLPTVAILPSGLGNIYPLNFNNFSQDIVDSGGCVMSEYSYLKPMNKGHFHHRNRLIAALGNVTLVMQAHDKSGTMITANHAAQLGKPVLAVPGHALDERFRGNLKLLAEGGVLIRDALDLIMICRSETENRDLHVCI